MTTGELHPSANVLGLGIAALDMNGALRRVSGMLQGSAKGYICCVSVHGVMEARRRPEFASVCANAAMMVPDGMPLVWVGHAQGHSAMRAVTGPDMMLELFARQEFAETTHFFYGGVEGVAEELRTRLQQRFPGAQIVGTYTPPFRELTNEEEQDLVATIRELKPDIVWVGLGCPKQEAFMARYLPLLETKLMFGVGAAFDYHTGRIQESPTWVRNASLQWLHRLIQDPGRLWKRYLRNNTSFLWHIALQLTGLRNYPLQANTLASRHNPVLGKPAHDGGWITSATGKLQPQAPASQVEP